MINRLLTGLILFLAITVAEAQHLGWGVTVRGGTFVTMKGSEQEVELDYTNGIGLQTGMGLWLSYPVTEKGKLQLTLMQTGERQQAGEITAIDADGIPGPELKVLDFNLAVNSSAVYLHQFGNRWALGTGAGGKLKYFSQAKVSYKPTSGQNAGEKYEEKFDNLYRRKFSVYLPVEAQLKLIERLQLVRQIQVQLSNRLAAAETSFKEHDMGIWIGLNYGF